MVQLYTGMETEIQNRIMAYWKNIISQNAKTVKVEYNEKGFTLRGEDTLARLMYGRNCPSFVEENTPSGTKTVYWAEMKFEANGPEIKLDFNAKTDMGPAYLGSGEKKVSEFAEIFGLNVKGSNFEPEKGRYSAVLSLGTQPQKGEPTTVTV